MALPRIFIDGEHGTTGLLIRELLLARTDLQLVSIATDKRKDAEERRRLLNSVDVAILCLPDDAARESVAMLTNPDVAVVDASTAHRINPAWVFGFPEMTAAQPALICASKRIANPGCWSTCYIALMRPLVDAGLIPVDYAASTWGISGFSGGGRQMVEDFESGANKSPFFSYGLKLAHKHLPEMQHYSGLKHAPVFNPSVGNYRQGMLLHIPIALWALNKPLTGAMITEALKTHYAGQKHVTVHSYVGIEPLAELHPEALNGTNQMELFVFENSKNQQVTLVARLDNLGKGAGRAALQNTLLMLGLAA
jgi:N-acetyl-gamma-glutamyl-phosphate reductase